MKICVYAISKNESKFVDRWYESMKEADEIYVLDTGSTDDTIKKLKKHKINVLKKIINPWRFDVARNESLKLLPKDTDICVCTDLDEVFITGWRKKLEDNINKNINRIRYTYNWSLDDNNKPIVSFLSEKIHTLNDYEWINPVHEILKYKGNHENITTIKEIVLNHYPDSTKSRSSYLPLLELSIKEDPQNDRNIHYLGREYMYYQKYDLAIKTLKKHLKLKSSTWNYERSASMRFIARSYNALGKTNLSKKWYDLAIKEAPNLRDPLIEKAILHYTLNELDDSLRLIYKALNIKINEKYYINEPFTFDHTPYELLSVIYYKKNDVYKAIYYNIKALMISPNNKKLIDDFNIIINN